MLARVVASLGLAGTVAALVAAFAEERNWLAGANTVARAAFVADVPPGGRVCQQQPVVPAGTVELDVTAGTYGRSGPGLRTTVRNHRGGIVARGALGPGWREGRIRLPLDAGVAGHVRPAKVCISNSGPHPVAFAGAPSPPEQAARVGGEPAEGLISVATFAGEQPRWRLMPEVAQRMGVARGFWGGSAAFLAAALIVAVIGLAVALAARQRGRP